MQLFGSEVYLLGYPSGEKKKIASLAQPVFPLLRECDHEDQIQIALVNRSNKNFQEGKKQESLMKFQLPKKSQVKSCNHFWLDLF